MRAGKRGRLHTSAYHWMRRLPMLNTDHLRSPMENMLTCWSQLMRRITAIHVGVDRCPSKSVPEHSDSCHPSYEKEVAMLCSWASAITKQGVQTNLHRITYSPLDTALPPPDYSICNPASMKLKKAQPANSSARIWFSMSSSNKYWVCGYDSNPIIQI